MTEIEFFFDLSSPWTRLAFHNIQPIAHTHNAKIIWRPFLVGGVFNAVNNAVYSGRADPNSPKNRNVLKWLKDWARVAGVPMNFPSPHHPLRSVHAMRFCCVLEGEQPKLFQFATAAFEAYFGDARNLDEPATLVEIANECGFDGSAIGALSVQDEAKQHLQRNTQEVIDRGGFGSPTIFVNRTRMYFGNDQLPLVQLAIEDAAKPM